MRVAVDARELSAKPTGVGRYLSELLIRWSGGAAAARHEWRFFAHQRPSLPQAFNEFVEILPGRGGTAWEQWQLPRALARWRPDVLFAPGYTSPLTAPCPTVLTIHDVSFCAHPEWFSAREGWRRRFLTGWSARRARVVLTVSEFSRDEIVRHIGIPSAKVRVVLHGMSRRPDGSRAPLTRARERMILFVGSIFQRRHVDRLLTTFIDSVADRVPGSRLEIVGDNRTHPPCDLTTFMRAGSPAVQSRITIRPYVSDDVLAELYGRASVFAFLSEYEGFGLTPLEALAAGVPPLVLDTPVAREVFGPAAYYVRHPADRPALAEALVDLLTRDDSRQAILMHADEVLARYDWERAAAATLVALEDAAGG